VTQPSRARIVAEPGRVRVISVVEDARLEPEAVVEPSDWGAATEAELSMGFARGDEACLQELFRRLAPLIYTIAYRALDSSSDGEEITQEVFVSAWRGRDNYQVEKGTLSGWLIGITRHRIADRQRARGRDLRLVQAVTNTTDVQVQPETVSTLVDRIVLTEEIGRLPHPRGSILQLAFWEGRSYSQIAEQLDLPLGTVKSHARRALRHLRTQLAEVTAWPT
jgi:RNA polymerase sigma-70 factor, ECF subfamily